MPARRALEAQHQAALEMILRAPQLGIGRRYFFMPRSSSTTTVTSSRTAPFGAAGVNRQRPGVAIGSRGC